MDGLVEIKPSRPGSKKRKAGASLGALHEEHGRENEKRKLRKLARGDKHSEEETASSSEGLCSDSSFEEESRSKGDSDGSLNRASNMLKQTVKQQHICKNRTNDSTETIKDEQCTTDKGKSEDVSAGDRLQQAIVKHNSAQGPLSETKLKAGKRASLPTDPEVLLAIEEMTKMANMEQTKRMRQRQSMEHPKLYLKLDKLAEQYYRNGPNEPSLPVETKNPTLFTFDLQHLLLYSLIGNKASYKPRFCALLRPKKVSKVAVIVLQDRSAYDYICFPECWPFSSVHFDMKVDVCSPAAFGVTLEEELFSIPLSGSTLQKRNLLRKCSIISKDCADSGKPGQTEALSAQALLYGTTKLPVPKGADGEPVVLYSPEPWFYDLPEKIPRDILILNKETMLLENYPSPLNCRPEYSEFVFSKDEYEKVREQSPMYAVDCEMVITSAGVSELARVSVVDERLKLIYDRLVKPPNTVVNYLTRYSGITKAMLKDVTTTLGEVQSEIRQMLPADAIWCGQSLNSDLQALKMFHPYCIDTSVIYNISGDRIKKASLKVLSNHYLNKVIQNKDSGHDSNEDAAATMELVLLKLKNSVLFGDATEGGHMPHLSCYIEPPEESAQVNRVSTPMTCGNNSSSTTLKNNQEPPVNERLLMDRRALFFHRLNPDYFDNLLEVLHLSGKTVGVIDDLSHRNSYVTTKSIVFEGLTHHKKVTNKLKELLPLSDFVYAKYHIADKPMSPEKAMKKLDKHVARTWEALPEDSLLLVLLPGAMRNGDMDNGVCLMKLKLPADSSRS